MAPTKAQVDQAKREHDAAYKVFQAKLEQFNAMAMLRKKRGMEFERTSVHETLDIWLDSINELYNMAHGEAS